eukprot:CAMPEP_0198725298 /NCGR_PEP_ID=MMETSP1475-20131203/2634_1 /TAXON_ID= ORGANISM="Unidentified sp., Strain CCMP1999" /NCGR_SAMPLE_ID=MMETSP1475 /ASSEMBLY_ACC=CAM_ASM_001111 /LENGTH=68 /DNA_ID=CAMNT_0044487047 /DNA_START=81 /DNA_END=287 /DNA_ORIENTATION=+
MAQYWRTSGLTYLKYTNLSAEYLRKALKEPMRSKALAGVDYAMIKATWEQGKIVKREPVEHVTEGVAK